MGEETIKNMIVLRSDQSEGKPSIHKMRYGKEEFLLKEIKSSRTSEPEQSVVYNSKPKPEPERKAKICYKCGNKRIKMSQ